MSITFRAGSCSSGARSERVQLRGVLVPPWLAEKVANPPPEGGGLHDWTFAVPRQLHAHFTPDQIIEILTDATAHLDLTPKRRRDLPREIRQAVEHSQLYAYQLTRGTARKQGKNQRKSLTASNGEAVLSAAKSRWPEIDPEHRVAVIQQIGAGVEDLQKLSPVRFEGEESHAEEIIDALFPADSLLCVGRSNSEFGTHTREYLRGHLAELPLIVPSPMTAPTGRTKDGKESEHTLENTGPRRFLIVEFDSGTLDEQAALILHLARLAPLALVVHSGGKSLHSWFYCAGESEEMLFEFMKYARTLGADRATWPRLQFVRMPDGTRQTGERQRVLYFCPEVIR